VARQTAVRLRATTAKRRQREMQVVTLPEPTVAEARDADWQSVLDEELSRLPDRYRDVLVLCDLEGMTRREAARQLAIPEGSVASRLARARAQRAQLEAELAVARGECSRCSQRLEALDGLHWPCPSEEHPGSPFLHGRLWADPPQGPLAPFSVVQHEPPVERLSEEFPIRLTTGRRLESFNTGVQTGGFSSPLRRGESIDIHPEDGARLHASDGETVRIWIDASSESQAR